MKKDLQKLSVLIVNHYEFEVIYMRRTKKMCKQYRKDCTLQYGSRGGTRIPDLRLMRPAL